jgi:hypothetical protein
MDWNTARQRFSFLAEAFNGDGGFAPRVIWENQLVTSVDQFGNQIVSTRRVPKTAGPCHLVPYTRESAEKFAARAAVAVYENHLREACERFIGYLGRRRPMRTGVDAPLVQLLLGDADMRGNPLDLFWVSFALQAKARGTMLLLIDLPRDDGDDAPASLQQQLERRAVPLLRAIAPEQVLHHEIDDETGLFESVTLQVHEDVDGQCCACELTYDSAGWTLRRGERVLDAAPHPFGQCPILPFCESGQVFPHAGKYAQIADLSKRVFNARSELDEILRGQTFSLLTLQVPPEAEHQFNASQTAATIGTHSMLVHQGDQPAFIAPPAAPASTYLQVIDQLHQSIKRVAQDEATDDSSRATESGVARRMRFERLNADLASFALGLQSLERRMWGLFHRALGTTNRVECEWPTDFNLVDTMAELDVLTGMQAAGFPPDVLAIKRKNIAAAEFDTADDETKVLIDNALDQQINDSTRPGNTGAGAT